MGVFDTPLPIRDKSLINTCLLNPILDKDLISYSNSLHITTHFWCTSVGAYRIRPTNAYVHRQMIQPPGTCWGVCFCALPIRIKNLIPVYWMNLKPGGFWGACLCGQPHPGERPLKFVWMYAKPGGDETDMAIFTKNPAGMGRIWPYLPKTRRGWDEYGHIHRKPGEDWTNMAIFTENPARIGRIWPYLLKTRRGLDEYGHIYRKPGGNWMNMAISAENPAGIGLNMDTAIESLPWIGRYTFSGITFLARMGFV